MDRRLVVYNMWNKQQAAALASGKKVLCDIRV